MAGQVVIGIDPDTGPTAYAVATIDEVLEVGMLPDKLREQATVLEVVLARYDLALAVVESQEIFPGSPANDIIRLAQRAGILVGLIAAKCPPVQIAWPEPRLWKGQQPKSVNQGRTLTHYGISYALPDIKEPYAQPTGCAKSAKIRGYSKTTKGQWKHIGDAVGLALYGARALQSAVF